MGLPLRKSKVSAPPPCPLTECMRLLRGAWAPTVIWYLSAEPRRFGELRRFVVVRRLLDGGVVSKVDVPRHFRARRGRRRARSVWNCGQERAHDAEYRSVQACSRDQRPSFLPARKHRPEPYTVRSGSAIRAGLPAALASRKRHSWLERVAGQMVAP